MEIIVYKKLLDFIVDEKGCFVCTSHKPDAYGYPQMRMNHSMYKTHRFAFEQCFGEIPNNLMVRHKCDNRACVNPDHLLLGTHNDNMRDMVERNRSAKGESSGISVLKNSEIIEIRKLLNHGFSYQYVADIYGVGKTTISHIKHRNTWKHVL